MDYLRQSIKKVNRKVYIVEKYTILWVDNMVLKNIDSPLSFRLDNLNKEILIESEILNAISLSKLINIAITEIIPQLLNGQMSQKVIELCELNKRLHEREIIRILKHEELSQTFFIERSIGLLKKLINKDIGKEKVLSNLSLMIKESETYKNNIESTNLLNNIYLFISTSKKSYPLIRAYINLQLDSAYNSIKEYKKYIEVETNATTN